ncbi:hypothetical protein CAEBREN_32673 [Caenorhabditis brenneri]|uniref:Uncharacterized protein n=1 Tax=Caenorhabditis brenneri TaxID=135651 RepID=G0PHQ9_CAEBE|nr:hypothetical protein CAEBREN_32673 [Caenorhabditis brenneri]
MFKVKFTSDNPPYSSSEFYTSQYSDEEDLENSSIKARQSTRDLADGFEKAQQRYMFNVHSIEEKYKKREESDIPESKVEVDRYGNFFFPESMSGARQQAFVNRMYQNDALFGKGSVSAPRNSIQSFEGDNRALAKSLQLDKKFGRELRTAELPFSEQREERIYSSAYVSGIPLRANILPSSSSLFESRYSEDLDDDVFEKNVSENRRSHHGFNSRPANDHRPTTSSRLPYSYDVRSESDEDEEEEDFADDEENSENSDESFSEEDEIDESEATPPKVSKPQNHHKSPTSTYNRHTKKSDSTLDRTKTPGSNPKDVKNAESFPELRLKDSIKPDVSQRNCLPNNSTPNIKRQIKKEITTPKTITGKEELINVEKNNRTPGSKPVKPSSSIPSSFLCANESAAQVISAETFVKGDETEASTESIEVKKDSPSKSDTIIPINFVVNKENTVVESESKQTIDAETKNVPISVSRKETSKPTSTTEKLEEAVMALSERPNRTKKPTEKIVAMAEAKRVHNHEHSTEDSSPNSEKCVTNVKKRNSGKSPFCKHCEFIKEEKRKSKASGILLKNNIDSQKATTSTVNQTVPQASNTVVVSNEVFDKNTSAKKLKRNAPKQPAASNAAQVKRRPGTEASEEPEKKKQKLIDSDLLSIPSSMAIIVDTELIANENPSLSSSRIPQFSENSPSSSVWSTTVDVQWIKDVKKVQGKIQEKIRLPRTIEEYWRKTRIDVKAGYNVRF